MSVEDPKFSKVGLTVAGIASVLALIAANMGVIEYIKGEFRGVFASSQIRAMFLGIVLGVSFSSWVPYVFGESFSSKHARMITKLVASIITFIVTWELHSTGSGVYFAMFAGMAGAQVYSTATNFFYGAFPTLTPPALRSGPNEIT